MKSTMFLNNITCIDHAYVDENGKINGMSYNLCVEITGEVDETEQVVIDFSGCKKAIKQLVDESEHAIDHRLVLVNGYSEYVLSDIENRDRTQIDSPLFTAVSSVNDWYQEIVDVSLFDTDLHIPSDTLYMNYLTEYLENMLLKQLKLQGYPVTHVTVELSESFDLPSWANTHVSFHYAHGLRSSSSYGCQNIAHGHRSFIAVDAMLNSRGRKVLKRIAEEMSGYIVWDDNLTAEGAVAYCSQRGNFYLNIDSEETIVINTETTVENLANYIAKTYEDEFQRMGVQRVWVSEGLSKGAVVDIKINKELLYK
ncbi:6-pyruvoyl tetrahydropterin synthase-like protein [Vibrio phage ValKK3]|uniref:6-pyruvoyl tetrahydropterin synthase-like protein n=1 Tax=Vibrio phage ValKK3 TaxID=1610855 RepID=A0A0D4DAV2_9CAUD|nr:6-pyruvoyl tetrahydropterin synthase-like protein [Vibrio phage ValKK3]AJT60981.1 6-pyruvoyl tetrahydropterin synthase-like protein [Vibrio phage ValKK3]